MSSGRGWREVTVEKNEPREDGTKHSSQKKKMRCYRLFGTNSLKEGGM
jgi:hypothetical protein